MRLTAGNIMTTNFQTLTPKIPVNKAVGFFKKATEEAGRKIYGLMVIDDKEKLVGMISMYDILLFIRPKHIHVWGSMDDVDVGKILEASFERTRSVHVGDIMTPDVITVTPQTHVFKILDIMIKKHIRRLPVVEDGNIRGIVYISDLFYELLEKLTD
jgi:CBS domain-containing protein